MSIAIPPVAGAPVARIMGTIALDSSHPTDLGFMRQAEAFAEVL